MLQTKQYDGEKRSFDWKKFEESIKNGLIKIVITTRIFFYAKNSRSKSSETISRRHGYHEIY